MFITVFPITGNWEKLFEEIRGGFFVDLGKLFELQHIYPPLARFQFGNIRLGCSQQPGRLLLVQSGVQPGFFQPLDQSAVLFGVNGSFHVDL